MPLDLRFWDFTGGFLGSPARFRSRFGGQQAYKMGSNMQKLLYHDKI